MAYMASVPSPVTFSIGDELMLGSYKKKEKPRLTVGNRTSGYE